MYICTTIEMSVWVRQWLRSKARQPWSNTWQWNQWNEDSRCGCWLMPTLGMCLSLKSTLGRLYSWKRTSTRGCQSIVPTDTTQVPLLNVDTWKSAHPVVGERVPPLYLVTAHGCSIRNLFWIDHCVTWPYYICVYDIGPCVTWPYYICAYNIGQCVTWPNYVYAYSVSHDPPISLHIM